MQTQEAQDPKPEVKVAPEEKNGAGDADQSGLEALKAELEELKKAKDAAEAKAKDLGSRLTREQQVRAEMERFHTATIPQINKVVKSFEERWENSPQQAVTDEVETKTKPLASEIAQAKAAAWMAQILASNPNLHKYEARVIELGDEFPEKTYSLEGIRRLFTIAQNEENSKEAEKLMKEKEGETEKKRAFTESSSPQTGKPQPGNKTKLTSIQMAVAKKFGIKPEEYAEAIGKTQQIGETEWEE